MKKLVIACCVMFSMAGCAEHPYLSAAAAAAGAAVIANQVHKHHEAKDAQDRKDNDRIQNDGYYDDEGNYHEYRYRDDEQGQRHHRHHHRDY